MKINQNLNLIIEESQDKEDVDLKMYYSNFEDITDENSADALDSGIREFIGKFKEFSCISNETGKKCSYFIFLFHIQNDRVMKQKIFELEAILDEFTRSNKIGDQLEKYLDYTIQKSKTRLKVEVVKEYSCRSIVDLSNYEKAIFFYNIRKHLKDILIAINYLKSRFIGNPNWFKAKNVTFNPISNKVLLKNFIVVQPILTNPSMGSQLPAIQEESSQIENSGYSETKIEMKGKTFLKTTPVIYFNGSKHQITKLDILTNSAEHRTAQEHVQKKRDSRIRAQLRILRGRQVPIHQILPELPQRTNQHAQR